MCEKEGERRERETRLAKKCEVSKLGKQYMEIQSTTSENVSSFP